MIQPLESSKIVWALDWEEIGEPALVDGGFFLPTCVFVAARGGSDVLGREVVREIDQRRVENLLARIFSERGTPDEILIRDAPDWDPRAWKGFGRDFQTKVRLVGASQKPVPDPLSLLARAKPGLASQLVGAALQAARRRARAEVAQGLVQSAAGIRGRDRRAEFLKMAVACDDACGPAHLELADLEFHDGKLKAALNGYRRTVVIEEARWRGSSPRWWADRPTRVYMRALFGELLSEWHTGRLEPACRIAELLLDLNPADNQGVRFLLPLLYQLAEQPEAALEFFRLYEKRFPGDYHEPAFLFGWGLALSQADEESAAVLKYRQGILKNVYIAPLLLDLPDPRSDVWHPSDRAEPSYAYEFFDSFGGLWERDPSSLRVLREANDQAQPRLEEMLALRAEMADFQDQRYDPGHDSRWKELLARERKLTGEGTPGMEENSPSFP